MLLNITQGKNCGSCLKLDMLFHLISSAQYNPTTQTNNGESCSTVFMFSTCSSVIKGPPYFSLPKSICVG